MTILTLRHPKHVIYQVWLGSELGFNPERLQTIFIILMFKALKDFLTYLLVSKAFLSNKNDGSYPLWPFLTVKKDIALSTSFLNH